MNAHARCLSLLLIACATAACTDRAASLRAETLVYCSEGAPESLNPHTATTGSSADAVANMLFDRLFDYDDTTQTLQPALAERFSWREHGRVLRIHLRQDVAFHHNAAFQPTRPLNADDVVFSFERQRDDAHPFHATGSGSYSYFVNLGLDKLLARVEAVDAHTVDFHLREEAPWFLSLLAMPFSSILSAEYAGDLQRQDRVRQFDSQPIGTGPFQLIRYEEGEQLRYRAHPGYFRGAAPLKQVVFAITADPALRLVRLRTGECDVMAQPAPHQIDLIRKNPDLQLIDQAGLNLSFWAFNTQRAPLNNPEVRRALAMAMNRKAILENVYAGAAELADTPVPPSIAGHSKTLVSDAWSLEEARARLRDAGFPNGFRLTLWATPVSRPYNPNARKTAELVQENLRQIGVQARIVTYEWNEFLQRVRRGEHDSVLIGWTGDMPDADNFLRPLLSCDGTRSGSNRALWCHEAFDALITQARASTDPAERARLYEDAQALVQQEMPLAPIAYSKQVLVQHRNVRGIRGSVSGGVFFDRAEKLP